MPRAVGAYANNGTGFDAGPYEVGAPTNNAPVFTSTPPNPLTKVGTVYSYSITVTDADADTITITAPVLPSWLTLTDNGDGTATLTGTPAAANYGANSVTLRASDGTDTTDQSVTVRVLSASNVSRLWRGAVQPNAAYIAGDGNVCYRYKGAVQPAKSYVTAGVTFCMDLVTDLVYDLVQDLVG